MTTTPEPIHEGGDGHGEHGHGHHPHLAHHFESLQQQYASAKVGMWVFLGTEILMFGGLFTAYAVYRGTHPEVFLYAHHFLDTTWGAINTVILLLSSFTMAWAVRAAQLGQRTLLTVLLGLTLLGGFGFMGIKSVEYYAKHQHHVWFGTSNAFYTQAGSFINPEAKQEALEYGQYKIKAKVGEVASEHADPEAKEKIEAAHTDVPDDPEIEVPATEEPTVAEVSPEWERIVPADHSVFQPTASGPRGLASLFQAEGYASDPYAAAAAAEAMHTVVTFDDLTERQQGMINQFFQIYFLMTGLHGLHVLIGMGLIGWVLIKSLAGTFGPTYFTPVDLVGLYWHLVDLIWIFLFPLLYLIH